MEAKHLRKDELLFELRYRGIADFLGDAAHGKTVAEMEAALTPLLIAETRGQPVQYPPYEYDYDVEVPLIVTKYSDLLRTINKYQDPRTKLNRKRLYSQILHLINRINVAPIESATEENLQLRNKWMVKVSSLLPLLDSSRQVRENLSGANLSRVFCHTSINESSDSDSDSSRSNPSIHTPVHQSTPDTNNIPVLDVSKSIPVHKWGLKFTGEERGPTVLTFLERVNELKVARHVSDNELFTSAIDLFEGKAITWFRSVQGRCNNWQEFADLLLYHYVPPDYRHRLFNDILARTQGPNEKIVDYIATMTALCNRHGSIPEDVRLSIISRNLSPFYTQQLPVVQSVAELESECLKLEIKKYRVDNYKPPSRRSHEFVEPGLACIEAVEMQPSTSSSSRLLTIKCFNCDKVGHMARDCSEPKRRQCYKCHHPGVTTRTCTICKSGNDKASRPWSGQSTRR